MKQIVLSTFFSIVAIQSSYSQVLRWSYDVQAPEGLYIQDDAEGGQSFSRRTAATPGGDIAFCVDYYSLDYSTFMSEVIILSKTGTLKNKFQLPNNRYVYQLRLTPTHVYLNSASTTETQYWVSTYRRLGATSILVGETGFFSYIIVPTAAAAPRGFFFIRDNSLDNEGRTTRLSLEYYEFLPPRLTQP